MFKICVCDLALCMDATIKTNKEAEINKVLLNEVGNRMAHAGVFCMEFMSLCFFIMVTSAL